MPARLVVTVYGALSSKISHRLLLLCGLCSMLPVAAAQSVCDSTLHPLSDPMLGYRERDSRCEGLYRSQVSRGSLDVVSLSVGHLYFRHDEGERLRISSPPEAHGPVHVRAVGIPLRLYYRLDARIAAGGVFEWPTSILTRMKLSPKDIGVFGFYENRQDVYVPLVLSTAGRQETRQPHLIVRASVGVDEVYWRYSELVNEACASMSDYQLVDSVEGFAAGQPIHISVPTFPKNICVEIAAKAAFRKRWLKRLVKIDQGT